MKLKRLPVATLVYWGLASMGLSMIAGIFGTTLPMFYQDYLGLSARWISIASIVYAAWNAINDPLVGFVSDNTRSRWGRRIPYLRFTAPFLAVTFFLVWLVPGGIPELGVFIWMLISMVLYDTSFTIIGLVQSALLPEISEYEEDRSALQISAALANLVGFALGFVVPQMFRPKAGESASLLPMRIAMAVAAVTGAALVILLSIKVKERPALYENQPRVTIKEYISFTYTSRSGLVVIAGNFMRIFVQAVMMGAIFYLADYLIRMNGMLLMALFIVPMVAGIACTTPVRRRIGLLATQQLYFVLGGLGLISMYFMPISLLPISVVIAGFGMGGPESLTTVMLSEAIDEDELRTGKRREGAFFGTNALLTKPAQSLALAVPPAILEATGFVTRESNAGVIFMDQPESALTGIRLYAGLIPGLAYFAAAAILLLYPIKGAYKEKLEAEVLSRHEREEANSTPPGGAGD